MVWQLEYLGPATSSIGGLNAHTETHQSLLAPPLRLFKNLEPGEKQTEAYGNLSLNRRGIKHICQLNRHPE